MKGQWPTWAKLRFPLGYKSLLNAKLFKLDKTNITRILRIHISKNRTAYSVAKTLV